MHIPYFCPRRRSGEGRKPLAGLPDTAEGEEEDGAEAGPAVSSLPHTQRGAARTITLLSAERVNAIIAKVYVLLIARPDRFFLFQRRYCSSRCLFLRAHLLSTQNGTLNFPSLLLHAFGGGLTYVLFTNPVACFLSCGRLV